MEKTLIEGNIITSAELFMDEYQMDVRKAKECLLTRGVPVTTLYSKPVNDNDAGAMIAETTSAIITCLDSLNLGNHAVDDVHPQLKDVVDSITKVPHLPHDFPELISLRQWYMHYFYFSRLLVLMLFLIPLFLISPFLFFSVSLY